MTINYQSLSELLTDPTIDHQKLLNYVNYCNSKFGNKFMVDLNTAKEILDSLLIGTELTYDLMDGTTKLLILYLMDSRRVQTNGGGQALKKYLYLLEQLQLIYPIYDDVNLNSNFSIPFYSL